MDEKNFDENTNITENKDFNDFAASNTSYDSYEELMGQQDSGIQHVSSGGDKPSKKKPIIIAVCVVVAIVLIALIIYFAAGGNDSDETSGTVTEETTDTDTSVSDEELLSMFYEDITNESGEVVDREEYVSELKQQAAEATTVLSGNVGVTSSNVIVDTTTTQIEEGDQAENTEQVDAALEQIEIFLSQKFYMEGAMYTGSEGNALMMSFDGNDFEWRTNIDDIEVSVCNLDGILYLKRIGTKQYVELDDNLMGLIGFTTDDLTFNFTGDSTPEEYATYDVTINDSAGVCYVYTSESGFSKFYAVDGELVEIDMCDESGNVLTQLTIDVLSSDIPADQLTIKGYEKSSISAIFADMMDE